jgi:hypothetical protein
MPYRDDFITKSNTLELKIIMIIEIITKSIDLSPMIFHKLLLRFFNRISRLLFYDTCVSVYIVFIAIYKYVLLD